jgi:hypothetical protein
MQQYLHGSVPWWSADESCESELGAEALGDALHTIICSAIPEPKSLPTSHIQCPMICIVGKPFSGKTTLSSIIAEQFGYALLNMDDLVTRSAINDADYLNLIEGQYGCARGGVVLDGFPETLAQSEALQRHLTGFVLAREERDRDGTVSRTRRSDLVPYPVGVPSIAQPPFKYGLGCFQQRD